MTKAIFEIDYDWLSGQWQIAQRPTLAERMRAARETFGRMIAGTTFPNHLGNYRGKRSAAAAGRPLAPRERFARLAGHFLCHRQTYRNGPYADPNWQARYFAEHGRKTNAK